MSLPEVVVGRISHVGASTADAHCRTYSSIEIETSSGRCELKPAISANESSRAIKPGNHVAISLLSTGAGKKSQNVILGIHDIEQARTFKNEDMYLLQAHAKKQAILYSLMSVIMVPVGLLLFVVPGLLWIWVVWRSWGAVERCPSAEQIQSSVASLERATKQRKIWEPSTSGGIRNY